MSDQAQWDAVKALLDASEHLADHVFELGMVPGAKGNPGTLPDYFVTLSVERRFVQPDRSGAGSVTGWRITADYDARTAANARTVGGWVSDALEPVRGRGLRVTVDGVTSTRIAHETTQAVDRDGGRFSGSVTYTYAL